MLKDENKLTIELDAQEIDAIVGGLRLYANDFLYKSIVAEKPDDDINSRLFMIDLIERFPAQSEEYIELTPSDGLIANQLRELYEPIRTGHRTDSEGIKRRNN